MPRMTSPATARRQDDALLGRPRSRCRLRPGPDTYPSVTLPRVTRTRVGLDLRTWCVPHASSALSFALRARRCCCCHRCCRKRQTDPARPISASSGCPYVVLVVWNVSVFAVAKTTELIVTGYVPLAPVKRPAQPVILSVSVLWEVAAETDINITCGGASCGPEPFAVPVGAGQKVRVLGNRLIVHGYAEVLAVALAVSAATLITGRSRPSNGGRTDRRRSGRLPR